jgi:hypothetical protein
MERELVPWSRGSRVEGDDSSEADQRGKVGGLLVQPYVIKQGDYLALIAYRRGFDADTVWNDPSNDTLRGQRSDPNLLFPGDVLYVPDPPVAQPQGTSLQTGASNSFTSCAPTVQVNLKFVDASLASQAVTIPELPDMSGLTTGADGTLALTLPITLQTFSVAFPNDGPTFSCQVGDMNPLDTVSGIAQRLQNLGYLNPNGDYDSDDLDAIRAALLLFQANQPGAEAPPGSDPAPLSTTAPASSPSSTATPPASSPPPSQPDSSPAPSAPSSPPSSSPSSPPPSSQGSSDNAGLADDGTLDDAIAQLLKTTHGS